MCRFRVVVLIFEIDVWGRNFGTAPERMPFTGDVNPFILNDWRSHCGSGSSLFEAGATRWGAGNPDGVTVKFEKWTENEISIGGFAGAYGKGCASIEPGDPLTFALWRGRAKVKTSPQVAWAVSVPAVNRPVAGQSSQPSRPSAG